MKKKPQVQGYKEGSENDLCKTPEYIQAIIYLHGKIIIQKPKDYYGKEKNAGAYSQMNAEPLLTKEYNRIVRTIYQQESKKEDRKYDHMQKLRDKTTENS